MPEVIVLGQARSGTSAFAGILHHLGVDMGEKGDHRSAYNPAGYFENTEIREMVEDFHVEMGFRPPRRNQWLEWDEMRYPDAEEILKKAPEFWRDKFGELIEKYRREGWWGWKSPETIFCYPLLLPFLEDPHFLVVNREIKAHTSSLMEIAAIRNPENARRMIRGYYEAVEWMKRDYPDLSYGDVSYDNLKGDKRGEIERVVSFLKLNPVDEQLKKADDHIYEDRGQYVREQRWQARGRGELLGEED